MWNRDLAGLVAEGSLRQIGIVLEQHPDRARLFAQWQQIAWPIYADAMDLLDLAAVPMSFLLDGNGVVVAINPTEEAIRRFVSSPESVGLNKPPPWPPYPGMIGEFAFLEGDFAKAIQDLSLRVQGEEDAGRTRFRLGVARMAAAELFPADSGLFAAALEDWRAALAESPSQYVWRRRIQQYGPQLDKPYPFYDWVATARAEIRARGEEPTALRVEPSGAELAQPRREGVGSPVEAAKEPDPDRALPPLPIGSLHLESAVVAGTQEQPVVRVHVLLTPVAKAATWNDEGEPAEAWLRAPTGWELVDGPRARIAAPSEPGGAGATRRLEFELRRTGKGGGEVDGYLLLDLCLAPEAVCVRARLDFRVPLP